MSGYLIKKTRLSARAVPLQAKAIEALDPSVPKIQIRPVCAGR
jgi:hypothetical protein